MTGQWIEPGRVIELTTERLRIRVTETDAGADVSLLRRNDTHHLHVVSSVTPDGEELTVSADAPHAVEA